jgi:hypothetical protein
MPKKFLAKPLLVPLSDSQLERVRDMGRRLNTTAPAIVRLGVELALDEWEQNVRAAAPVPVAAANPAPRDNI